MCLYPKLIQNRKYMANKKNGGIIPPLPLYKMKNGKEIKDMRVTLVPVGCGKCMECMKKKAREWNVRLSEEIRSGEKAKFITMTFSNESIKELGGYAKNEGYERDNEIATVGVRRFLERWRKKYKKSIKHWLVTELGHEGTENIHIHGIIWTKEKNEEIEKIWKYGYIWIGEYVNERTVNYITKYINKIDLKHEYYKPKVLTSPGIGKDYIKRIDSKKNKYKKEKTEETYKNRKGYKLGLPVYYRNNIYTEEEREKLWIEKLEKNERYINGVKIDIKKNEKEYHYRLEEARKLNKELKYGTNEIDWDKKRYEKEKRNINYIKRMKDNSA